MDVEVSFTITDILRYHLEFLQCLGLCDDRKCNSCEGVVDEFHFSKITVIMTMC